MNQRHVLLVIEDEALVDILRETLTDQGHAICVTDADSLVATLARQRFDAAIVDLDTRGRAGMHVPARLRAAAPATTIVARLPYGGLPDAAGPLAYDLAIEKPARLGAVVRAVNVARAVVGN
jgi:DNA-binding NtrC family response regulator